VLQLHGAFRRREARFNVTLNVSLVNIGGQATRRKFMLFGFDGA
jgi:hypothetical protein